MSIDESGRKHAAQSTAPEVDGWPKGVRPISTNGLGHLGVGDDGTLYWDGNPVEIRKTLVLTKWQRRGAFIVSASAVMAAFATVASAIADYLPHC